MGSGPVKSVWAPFLTRMFSFTIHLCAGTQSKVTLLFPPTSLSLPRYSQTILELAMVKLSAVMAA